MTHSPIPEELLRLLRSGSRFLLTSHANPDGDAIGTEIGLARILRQLGKSVTIWNHDPSPSLYRHLPGIERVHVGEDPPAGFPEDYDRFVLLECPGIDRTGLENRFEGLDLINIDHHLGNDLYGVVNWVDTAAPAVGEMVRRLADALKVTIDPDTATALYLAIVTDTGNFRFSNATPMAFRGAAQLVERGASPERVSQWLYESQPLGMVRLLGEMLTTLEVTHDGRVATALLTPEMYQRAGASREDSEGLIDYIRAIEGVDVVALLRVIDGDKKVKASLRSRGDVSVESVAKSHDGGGHRNAAGCVIEADIASARDTVASELGALLETTDRSGGPGDASDHEENDGV